MLKIKLELERKFKVNSKKVPWLTGQNLNVFDLKQSYLFKSKFLEIRSRGEYVGTKLLYYLVFKLGLKKTRLELTLPVKKFYRGSKPVLKTRCSFLYEGYKVEWDSFSEKDLNLIEIEFKSFKEMKRFKPFDWLGEEVSNNINYYNKNL